MNTERYYREIKRLYGECCAICKHININCTNKYSSWGTRITKYKCDNAGWLSEKYHYLTEHQRCYREGRYLYYDRDYEDILKKIQEERKYYHGYFILTAIFDILNISKENRIYQEISSLIDVVRDDTTTKEEANDYEHYGPIIANLLRMDDEGVAISEYLFNNYIKEIYISIGYNDQEKAIETYKDMVMILYDRYKKYLVDFEKINYNNEQNEESENVKTKILVRQ